jgi:pyrimidine operon attenuation protein/uracil phosphoribosyltransferase
MGTKKNYILSKEVAEKKMRRMALEIIESNQGEKEIILAGIKESGTVVAKCIQKMLAEFSSIKTGIIEISLDKRKPHKVALNKKIDFNDKVIIVIDDVANSGKTLLYALKPFLEFHPKKIQSLVLVERSHNSFPVRPDYVGLSVSTTLQEQIIVEVDGKTVIGAYLK